MYNQSNLTVNSLSNSAREYNYGYMTETLGDRLKARMAEIGMNQPELAERAGVSQTTISQIVSGRNRNSRFIVQLAAALKCSPRWLATGKGPKEPPDPIDVRIDPTAPESQLLPVRRVKITIQGGVTGYNINFDDDPDDTMAPIFFGRNWFDSRKLDPARCIATTVKGRSMEPGLNDGDTVVFNTADIVPRDGEVFAVNYEGEPVVKRMKRNLGQWWLSSDNPDKSRYADKVCDERVEIIGRIVHKQSEQI